MLRRSPLKAHVRALHVPKTRLGVWRHAHPHAECLVLLGLERNDALADVVVTPRKVDPEIEAAVLRLQLAAAVRLPIPSLDRVGKFPSLSRRAEGRRKIIRSHADILRLDVFRPSIGWLLTERIANGVIHPKAVFLVRLDVAPLLPFVDRQNNYMLAVVLVAERFRLATNLGKLFGCALGNYARAGKRARTIVPACGDNNPERQNVLARKFVPNLRRSCDNGIIVETIWLITFLHRLGRK